MTAMIGLTLNDRYRLESELGRGGMGTVYRAQDTLLERPVAIKVVSHGGLGTEGQARLLQEARAAALLNHPNIVAVYDVSQAELPGYEGLVSFIVMELVEGQTLREQQPQDLEQVIEIARAICEALEAAHGQGIIHRDLKPENVSLSANNTVKLMDFGLARMSGKTRLTQKGAFIGTLSYLAPEIILGQEASPRSDLYALGVMLYEMSTGRPPFEADNLTAVISQHLHAPVVPPSAYNEAITADLERLIVQLLSKRPEARPASAEEVGRDLASLSQATAGYRQPAAINQLNRLVRGRMVGREEELSQAVSLWERSAGGDGQLLLISGEPGIGKTRFVKELNAYAEISGGRSLLGLCYAQERTPYGPIAQMVGSSLGNGFNLDLPQEVLADLLAIAPELRLRYPDLQPAEHLDPEAEQQRLFESIITWLGALTAGGRLLLVIDDVHWADSGSLSLLGYLSRRLNNRRAMVVATYREVDLDEGLPFHQTLRDLNRERLATRIKLTRLDKERTHDLLATLFAEEITPEFLDAIYRETEGVPFFVEEVCKALVDDGKLTFQDGRWVRPAQVAELEIPQGIRLTIQSRLGRLTLEELSTLQLAALLGREFDYELLAAVSALGEELLIDALESAEEAQLIEEKPGSRPGASPRFAFTHALIHSTLLSDLSTLRRRRYQRKIAQALEDAFPERQEELASLLGRYFAEAGDAGKAINYLLTAGNRAREVFAYSEAVDFYEEARQLLQDREDHERAARTLMKLGLTYHNLFAFDSAQRAYEQGFSEWQRAADSEAAQKVAKTPAPHPFRAVVGLLPDVLDPSSTSNSFPLWFMNQIYSRLLHWTADDELVPDVAQSWEVLDGGRTYIFHLRDDVVWSDGTPVTAADYEASWKQALHPDNDQGLGEIFFDTIGARAFKQGRLDDPDLIGIQAPDAHTLVVRLENPTSYFLQVPATAAASPVPRHLVEKYGPEWHRPEKIVTNGPFAIQSWKPEKSVVLERYEAYHGRFKGNISQVILDVVRGRAGVEMYQRDDLDILYPYDHVSVNEAKRLIQGHPDEYLSWPALWSYHLILDVTGPPLDDPRARQALVLAIDRDALANRVLRGREFPASGGLVPPIIEGHVPGIALPYDPALAREKLAEAGYPGGRGAPPLRAVATMYGERHLIIEHLATQWKTNLGIEVSVEVFRLDQFKQYNDALERARPNLYYRGWEGDYADPDSYLRVANWLEESGWRNEPYQALVDGARRIADQRQRLAMYRQAEGILLEEAPIIPLTYGREHVLIKPWIASLPAAAFGGNILKDIIIEPH